MNTSQDIRRIGKKPATVKTLKGSPSKAGAPKAGFGKDSASVGGIGESRSAFSKHNCSKSYKSQTNMDKFGTR